MEVKYNIFKQLVLVAGPPRSGTTFMAKSLNSHPKIITAVDDYVYECWALYYYRTRSGLIQRLREHALSQGEVYDYLYDHLIINNQFKGIAPSLKTANFANSPPMVRPDGSYTPMDRTVVRHVFPLAHFTGDLFLCLKSPEVSYCLPQLCSYFPQAKFIFVYRPIIEIAESMYRRGNLVKKVPIFHKRWEAEVDTKGKMIPPPGIPIHWIEYWNNVSGFQRCIINAASYLNSIVEGLNQLPETQFFVYNHVHMRTRPKDLFEKLSRFLKIEESGFDTAIKETDQRQPPLRDLLIKEYVEIEKELKLDLLLRRMEAYANC
jgi:hypothetical protein